MKKFIKGLLKNKFFYLVFVCLIIFIILLSNYMKNNSTITTFYDTNYDVGYDVYIKDSDYFNTNVLGMERQYISRLIDHIKIKSNIKYSFSSKSSFSYVCDIKSKVTVKNTNTEKNLLEFEETNSTNKDTINKSKSYVINNDIDIDFNKYNDLVKSFVSEYNLKNSSSTLEVVVQVKLNGLEKSNSENFRDSMKIKYIIPLNEETIDIKTEYVSNNNDLSYFIYRNDDIDGNNIVLFLIIDFILMVSCLFMLFKDYIFIAISKIKVTQSETDKILKKYGTFIHEVDNFNINKYSEKIYLKSFDSLLDLKDTTNNSIFIKRGRKYNYFFILQQNRLYIYTLNI